MRVGPARCDQGVGGATANIQISANRFCQGTDEKDVTISILARLLGKLEAKNWTSTLPDDGRLCAHCGLAFWRSSLLWPELPSKEAFLEERVPDIAVAQAAAPTIAPQAKVPEQQVPIVVADGGALVANSAVPAEQKQQHDTVEREAPQDDTQDVWWTTGRDPWNEPPVGAQCATKCGKHPASNGRGRTTRQERHCHKEAAKPACAYSTRGWQPACGNPRRQAAAEKRLRGAVAQRKLDKRDFEKRLSASTSPAKAAENATAKAVRVTVSWEDEGEVCLSNNRFAALALQNALPSGNDEAAVDTTAADTPDDEVESLGAAPADVVVREASPHQDAPDAFAGKALVAVLRLQAAFRICLYRRALGRKAFTREVVSPDAVAKSKRSRNAGTPNKKARKQDTNTSEFDEKAILERQPVCEDDHPLLLGIAGSDSKCYLCSASFGAGESAFQCAATGCICKGYCIRCTAYLAGIADPPNNSG